MNQHVWGAQETEYFYKLTPDKILDAVEAAGFKCTGRCFALNSMENRVYDIELTTDLVAGTDASPSNKFSRSVIAKFYRPGRWTREQILDEHAYLSDLADNDLPVISPVRFCLKGGDSTPQTLNQIPESEIWYALFPKKGGRSPSELDEDQVARIGRLLARVHNVGEKKISDHRLKLNPTTYGRENLNYLTAHQKIPPQFVDAYTSLVTQICDMAEPHFARVKNQRIHGDCHLGNILWDERDFFLVDFDDMVTGPCVQDIWLVLPGNDAYSLALRKRMIDAYDVMRAFDYSSIKLIEVLRALRFVHFSAWIAKRWTDPAFPRAFPYFGTEKYWAEQVVDLRQQLEFIQAALAEQSYYQY